MQMQLRHKKERERERERGRAKSERMCAEKAEKKALDCVRKRKVKKRKEKEKKETSKMKAAANEKAPFIMVAIIPNQSAHPSIQINHNTQGP